MANIFKKEKPADSSAKKKVIGAYVPLHVAEHLTLLSMTSKNSSSYLIEKLLVKMIVDNGETSQDLIVKAASQAKDEYLARKAQNEKYSEKAFLAQIKKELRVKLRPETIDGIVKAYNSL